MEFKRYSFRELLSNIVDNRGKTCPVEETGLPLIATNCIRNDALYAVYDKVRYVSETTYKEWFRSHPKPEDIIFVCKGSPGRVVWVQDPVPFCIAQDMVAIRADKSKIDPKFLFALLRAPQSQNSILNMHVGTLIPHFKKGDFGNLYFDIPVDMKCQKFAGELHFKICEKIEHNRQLNQTLEHMAQALFKSWFVDFDPVIDNALAAGNPIPDDLQDRAERRQLQLAKADHKPLPENIRKLFPSEFELTESLGWVPLGWGVKNLTNLVDTVSKTYPLKSVEKVIFLNTGDIEAGLFLHNNYSDAGTLPGQAKKSIQHGDILYSEIRPKNKRFAYVNFDGSDHVVSTKLMVLRAKSGIDSKFIYFVLTRESCLDELQRIAELRSGTFPQITFDELSLIELPIPDNAKILNTFSELMLNSYYEKQFQLQLQSKELSQLRDTLLPKLISGELRIPEAESALTLALSQRERELESANE